MGICGVYLSLSQLYELKSNYNLLSIYVCSNWNNAYDKCGNFI